MASKHINLTDIVNHGTVKKLSDSKIESFIENHFNKYRENEYIREKMNDIPEYFWLETIWNEDGYELKDYLYSIFEHLLPHFGKAIKQWRINSDLTQKELADKLNVAQSYISTLEKTKDFTNEEIKKEILNFFGCSIDDWLLFEYMTIGYGYRYCTFEYFIEKSDTLTFNIKHYYPKTGIDFPIYNKTIIVDALQGRMEDLEYLYNSYYYEKILKKVNELNSNGKQELLRQMELLLRVPDFKA